MSAQHVIRAFHEGIVEPGSHSFASNAMVQRRPI